MIQMQTSLVVADNSGAKSARCIKVLGGSNHMTTGIADIIVVSITSASPNGKVKKGDVCKAVVIRTAKEIQRVDGSSIKFDGNAVVLINKDGSLIGTRVFGPVARELKNGDFAKILSLAPEVL